MISRELLQLDKKPPGEETPDGIIGVAPPEMMKGQVYYMPKARKTKAGSYRVTVYDYKDSTGKVHQKVFTASTKREAERLANQYKVHMQLSDIMVGEAVKRYIESKKGVLSPSTHRSYMSIYHKHFERTRFGGKKILSLDTITVQRFISDLDLSPKTVRNIAGLLTATIKMFCPDKALSITFPAKKKPDLYTPTSEDIKTLMDAVSGEHDLFVCVLLYTFGPMRRSEICAVKYSDIDYKANTITVRRSKVRNDDNQWVDKDIPKTYASYRTIIFPQEVIDIIGKGIGYIIKEKSPAALTDRFPRVLNSVGLPHFRMHDLRHYSASVMHCLLNMPDKLLMARGGWSSPHVLRRVYVENMAEAERQMNEKVVDFFTGKFVSNQ